jgi:two-component system OmpR family sensor kinase
MSRLPVRVRLTLAFAVAMALVLALVGTLLYVRLGASLEEQLDETLELRAQLGSAALAAGDDESFGQVIGGDGRVLSSSPLIGPRALLSANELARGRRESFFLRRDEIPSYDAAPARLFVSPFEDGALVVGASLEDVGEAQAGLLTQLLVLGPLALGLTSLGGYLLAGAALRPVESMRSRAAAVSSDRPGQRLPLPAARDEIRRLGETLNAMLGRLEDGLARERRFVADASHDLRTPLGHLQTELELALRRPRSREELEQALRSASEEVERLVRLAEALLVLARADDGRLPLHRTPLEPARLLHAVAERFSARAVREGRTLDVVADEGARVDADRLRLEQALGNLVDNALRHGAGHVRIAAEARDGRVELSVADEGPGFPPDFLPHAFERFTRADEARTRGGSGLGLAIVDAVARAHGGEARAANRVPAGALVTLTIPADGDTLASA